ncbi:MAG: CusA/CzcA family heavy metal efflux RND transporter [Candidatus Krumholzibacteria bacterium]|nr:CusA/CzcA family heavy metal efflux RND transporter [Candidatus Krumholzibacteria bacterium]
MLEKIIGFGLRNRLIIAVGALLLMGAGYYSYTKLPVDAFPDVSPNLVQVFTVTEGLAPEEIEKYVTYPVEAAMTGLPGVQKVRSVSNFGLSVVNIYFDDGMDIYFARQVVGERLQEAREQIPAGFGDPEMGPIATGMGLVLFYYLDDTTGKYSLEELRSIQDWLIKFNLQTVPGVTEVLGIGGYEKQFQVEVKPEQLLRYGVTLGEIIERVRANNLNVGAQFIEKNSEEFVVRSIGLVRDMDDLREIVVRTEAGRPIFLGDLAEVKIGGAVRRGLQSRNGTGEVVAGQVIKLFGTNSSEVIARVEEKMVAINRILPEGLTIVPYYEQKTLVSAAVKTVTDALLQGVILVALVLLFFMGGLRPSLVVALSLPFSVLFAFLAMRQLGMTANLMSLGGLAIAIGMMVDGTIVMIENVDRHLRQSDPAENKIKVIASACGEVARPILFAIGIIILVFVPLFTLQGVEGKTFRPLAYTVALAMLGSLIFAIGVAPMLSSVFMKRSAPGAQSSESWMQRWLTRSYRPVARLFVDHRWAALVLAAVLIAAGLTVAPRLGSEFTPRLQEGTVVVRLTLSPSIAMSETQRVTGIVERRLMAIPEVHEVISRIGRGEVGAHTDPVNSAEIAITLHPEETWRTDRGQEGIEDLIRQSVGDVPGVLVNLTQPIAMAVDELLEGVRAELAIKIFGDDIETLKESAEIVSAVIREVPGAADVQVDQITGAPQLVIRIDRGAIARYGLNVADVQEVIRAAVGGEVAGQVFEGIRRFDIMVRFVPEARDSAASIRDILITAPGGAMVPLGELATIEEIVGLRQITRENNQRFVTIQCNVVDRDIGSFVAAAQEALDGQVTLPAGYHTTWGGQYRLQQEANKRMKVVVPVVLLFVFLLLFGNFGSVRNSLLILLNIPLALVGGVVALWLAGLNFSVPASIGFIALFGIALENGMVLITYMNQLVAQGVDVREASIRGACQRLRAVLMTAITTALGLLPLLFSHGTGSEVQKPLATVVIGGLVTSTVLTLIVLPALYKWFLSRRALN